MITPTAKDPVPLIQGDCFELLPQMSDASVGHVITDPPYSDHTHKGARTLKSSDRAKSAGQKLVHFDPITDDQFIWLCREFVRVASRWVIMTCDWRHAVLAEQHLPDEFVRLGVWTKVNGMPQLTGDRPSTGWEAVLILHRKGRKKWNGGGHPAVWHTKIAQNPDHPTEKPTALVRKWVRDFTDPGETVLDPFAGSGTTAASCWYEGRLCLSIEKDDGFASAARSRLAKLTAAGALIPYKPPVKRDESLL